MSSNNFRAAIGVVLTAAILPACTPIIHPKGEYEERLCAAQNRPPDCDPKGLPGISKSAPIGDVLRYAFLSNPGIRTAFNEWVAALEQVPQAGALEDPQLSLSIDAQYLLGFDPMRRLGLQKPGQMKMKPEGGDWMDMRTMEDSGSGRLLDALGFGFQQAIPGAGKREARAEQALAEAKAAGLRFLNAERELRQAVITAYAELLHNRRRADVEEENLALFREIRDITLRNLASGVGTQADVLKGEVAITEAETELRAVRLEEPRLRARLNALLGRRATAPVGDLMGIEVKWKKKDAPELLELAIHNNPELSALVAEVRSQGAAVVLAELQYNPDFMFGTNIRMMEQMLMAGVSLPVYTERIEAQIREAVARHAASQTRYSSQVYEVMARLVAALAELEDAERVLEDLGEKLVPQLRELVQVQLDTYGAGGGAFLDILDTRRSFIQSARLLVRAESERLQALAELEEVAGCNLLRLKAVPYEQVKYAALQARATETTAPELTEMLVELPPLEETTGTLPASSQTTATFGFPQAWSPFPFGTPSPTSTPAPTPAPAATPRLPGRAATPAPALTPFPTPQPVRMDSGTTLGAVSKFRELFAGS